MDFCIQVSKPVAYKKYDDDDESLCEAIETIYPLSTEFAFIIWKNIYVPITYKYDLSIMISDVISMLEKLFNSTGRKLSIHWASNTFSAIWNMSWNNEVLKIDTVWNSVIGDLEGLLNQNNKLQIEKLQFISEWKQLLGNILKDLNNAGYKRTNLPELHKLQIIYNNIDSEGSLYRM